MALQHLPDELRAHKDVVLAAVSNDGAALQYASEALRGDEEVSLRIRYSLSY
jgi:hypothetical protein